MKQIVYQIIDSTSMYQYLDLENKTTNRLQVMFCQKSNFSILANLFSNKSFSVESNKNMFIKYLKIKYKRVLKLNTFKYL